MPKSLPRLWWDFYGERSVIVESDDNRYPILAIFTAQQESSLEVCITAAQDLIADIESGRKSISKFYTGLTRDKIDALPKGSY